MAPLFEVRNLRREVTDRNILSNISFTLEPGEIIFVRGPSGVGKSLLLRALACLDHPQVRPVLNASEHSSTLPAAAPPRATQHHHSSYSLSSSHTPICPIRTSHPILSNTRLLPRLHPCSIPTPRPPHLIYLLVQPGYFYNIPRVVPYNLPPPHLTSSLRWWLSSTNPMGRFLNALSSAQNTSPARRRDSALPESFSLHMG